MKLSNPLKYAIVIGLTGFVILYLVCYAGQKTIVINNENQSLIALAEHLKNNSAKARLKFERALAGVKNKKSEKNIYGNSGTSINLLTTVLNGGKTELGVFRKITDDQLIKIIQQSLLNDRNIKKLAQQRMEFKDEVVSNITSSTTPGDISPRKKERKNLEQAFEVLYEKIQGNYANLTAIIKLKITADNNELYTLFWTSILLIVIVFTIFSLLLYKIIKNESLIKEALILSEKRFRTIFEGAPLGIALIDSQTGVIQNANSKYLEIIGRRLEEMNNVDWMSITHPDDLEMSKTYMKALNENHLKGFKHSKRYVRPDGSIVWGDKSISIIESENKLHPVYLCMVADITARKKTEDALKASENELRSMFACMDDLIFELSSEGIYLKVAPTNPALLYQPADSLLGKRLDAVLPQQIAALFMLKIQQTLKENKIDHVEYILPIDNKEITFEATISPLTDNSVLWIARDISYRKKMEQLLKEKEQNDLLIRHAAQVPGTIYQFQISTDGTFSFPFVSEGIWDLCEITPQVMMQDASKIFSYAHPDDLEGIMASIYLSKETFENWIYDFRLNLPTKGTRWIRGNSKPESMADGSVLWHGYFTDITENKQAKEALQISKDKLEAVFNGSNDAIMLLTRKGFFDCNSKTLEMFGMKERREFTESHPADLSPAFQPDGQKSLNKAIEMIEIAFEKGVNRFEWEHTRENGKTFPAEVLLSAFNYGDERVLQATVHDITERKLAEKKLIENEALLTSILQTLPVAVFCKDIKNNFAFSLWNRKAEELFGLKAEECIGKDDYHFFSKKEADWFRKHDLEVSEMTEILDIPEEIVSSENKKVIVHTQKTVVKDFKGEPHFLLGVSEDITERKNAEEKIKKSEEKYRSVVENAADIIMTVSSDNKIQFINHTRPGVSIEQVIGTDIYGYVLPEYNELAKQKLNQVYENGKPQHFEIPGLHTDGSSAWYSANVGPLFSEDKVTGITLIIRDVSDRKKAEEKIQQSLKEKEVLLKEVHHRVKNNLQIILSILNLQYVKVSDKKTLDLLRDVRNRIKAMSFIHELLYQTDDFSSINFSEYITNITNNLVYSYSPNNTIDLKLDVGILFLDLDRAIPCGLIINELVTNALKYAFRSRDKGEISISLTQTNDFIRLVIADNGNGFPTGIDYRNTESLGLQLVVTLVEQLRGEISLDNSNGTKYTITFKDGK